METKEITSQPKIESELTAEGKKRQCRVHFQRFTQISHTFNADWVAYLDVGTINICLLYTSDAADE